MKIGFDLRMGGGTHYGIGRYSFELLKAMLNEKTEHEFTVIYHPNFTDSNILNFLKDKKSVYLVPVSIRHYSFSEQLRLPFILARLNLDVMHFPNFNVPMLYKKPFVVTIHDLVHHKLSGHKKSRLMHFWAYKKIIQNAINKSKIIIIPSHAAEKEILKEFPYVKEKTVVIYEGASLALVDRAITEKVKKQFLLHRPYFIFVGTLERKKNIAQLTKGFDEFLNKYKLDMDLVLVGKADPHYPDERNKALDIKNAERVIFTGRVSEQELSALYSGAFAYVSASVFEGFGLPGVEAMKFGLPLVVANTPVFNEIYDSAAVYFNPNSVQDIAEHLYLVSEQREFTKILSEKALLRGRFFAWDKTAKETLSVYKKIFNSRIETIGSDSEDFNDDIIPEKD